MSTANRAIRSTPADEKLGVFICYESVFPDDVRQFADNGAQVFVNISNDGWYGDSGAYAQHLNQTRMRAIENNRWLLECDGYRSHCVHRSLGPGRRADSTQGAHNTGRALCPHFRHYVLHAPRRLFAFACAIISLGALLARFLLIQNRKKAETSS